MRTFSTSIIIIAWTGEYSKEDKTRVQMKKAFMMNLVQNKLMILSHRIKAVMMKMLMGTKVTMRISSNCTVTRMRKRN